MILDNITNGSGPIVKCAAALNPKFLRHRNLHTLDVIAIPKWLRERIRKAEVHNVVDWPFPKVMVDAENRGLRKFPKQNTVQLSRRGEVGSERLLDDHPG